MSGKLFHTLTIRSLKNCVRISKANSDVRNLKDVSNSQVCFFLILYTSLWLFSEAVINIVKETGDYDERMCDRLRTVLLAPHKHKDRVAQKAKQTGIIIMVYAGLHTNDLRVNNEHCQLVGLL